MADYSKWDAMAKEEEAEEAREKEAKRTQNREKYYADQEERKKKYLQEQELKKKSGHDSHHGHSHGGDGDGGHGHSHGGDSSSQQVPLLEPIRRPACGCGYADVDELKRAHEESLKTPQISAEEKTRKKIAAVHATREHGKQLFEAGQYEQAFAVYERGVLIVSGIVDLSPEETKEMLEMEVILDLNMAACKLKLSQWKDAIEQCRLALQLDPKSVKAHFRWGSALIGLGEYEEAKVEFQKALDVDSTGSSRSAVQAQLAEIKRLEQAERVKVKNWTKQLEQKLAHSKDAYATPPNTSNKRVEEEKESDEKQHEVDEVAATLRETKLQSTTDSTR